ncbi:SDR family NAD(P)-dependent oxidoreductase [Spongiimicrobium salis]|uniref:SDR family NAD(P)-dependent oxidoreductase n=1 Tax=Spongiimicrobium salis TaxID=1667022 RepID=UPI00374DBBBF
MDLKLQGKTAFITGSTSGIGFATAKVLAEEGVHVILNGRKRESLNAAIKKLNAMVPESKVSGIAMDFAKSNAMDDLIKAIPKIDILINNVGMYTAQSFFDTTDKDWQQQLEVNMMSGVRLSRYFLPKMQEANWGRILFVSSECAVLVPEDLIAYSVTKAALLALSRGLAQLTKGTGVTVNTIVPGSTLTEGAATFLEEKAIAENKTAKAVEEDFFKEVRTSSLLQRFATPEEVAHTLAYYASPLAAAINGAAIKVDGGSIGGIL